MTSPSALGSAGGHADQVTPSRSNRPLLVLLVTGFVFVQLSWLLTVPPFRGLDEFDHAYRAAAVARGEWAPPPTAATTGTGAVLAVPGDIVAAAGPQCRDLPYTSSVDCEPGRDLGSGMVTVASGAGRYHPAYYAAVGAAALPFDGFAALYVMRLASIGLCAALFAAAAWSLLRWSRGPVPVLGLIIATTPVLIYSTAIVAPNGVEMVAALGVWTGGWGLLKDAPNRRGHLAVFTLGACLLVTLRSMGPFWLLLIVASLLCAAGRRREVLARLRGLANWRPGRAVAAGIVVVGVASCTWTVSMRSLALREETVGEAAMDSRLESTVQSVPLWLLQAVAAFPSRVEPAPSGVYVSALLAFLALVVAACLRARGRLLVVAAAIAVASLLVPFVITMATFADYATAWQGRYTLPLTVGMPLLLAIALDSRVAARSSALAVVGALVLLGLAHTVSVADVTASERVGSPLAGTGDWLMPPVWLVSVLAAVGVLLMCAAAWRRISAGATAGCATGTVERPAEAASATRG